MNIEFVNVSEGADNTEWEQIKKMLNESLGKLGYEQYCGRIELTCFEIAESLGKRVDFRDSGNELLVFFLPIGIDAPRFMNDYVSKHAAV